MTILKIAQDKRKVITIYLFLFHRITFLRSFKFWFRFHFFMANMTLDAGGFYWWTSNTIYYYYDIIFPFYYFFPPLRGTCFSRVMLNSCDPLPKKYNNSLYRLKKQCTTFWVDYSFDLFLAPQRKCAKEAKHTQKKRVEFRFYFFWYRKRE